MDYYWEQRGMRGGSESVLKEMIVGRCRLDEEMLGRLTTVPTVLTMGWDVVGYLHTRSRLFRGPYRKITYR